MAGRVWYRLAPRFFLSFFSPFPTWRHAVRSRSRDKVRHWLGSDPLHGSLDIYFLRLKWWRRLGQRCPPDPLDDRVAASAGPGVFRLRLKPAYLDSEATSLVSTELSRTTDDEVPKITQNGHVIMTSSASICFTASCI